MLLRCQTEHSEDLRFPSFEDSINMIDGAAAEEETTPPRYEVEDYLGNSFMKFFQYDFLFVKELYMHVKYKQFYILETRDELNLFRLFQHISRYCFSCN